MRLFSTVLTLTTLTLLFSCKGNQTPQTVDTNLNAQSSYTIEEAYGEQFEIGTQINTVDQTVGLLSSQDTVDVVLEANVEAVCKKKGCWMNLVDTSNPTEENSFFVKFKDYGFFMPLDSEGYKVLVKGKAYKEVTSVDELRHYAEDEGKSPEEIAKITEPTEELKILSTGVYKVKG